MPTQAEIVQELYSRRSELDPQETAIVDELMQRMTASGEIRGEPAKPQLPGRLGMQEAAPRQEGEQGPPELLGHTRDAALSRFFSSLGSLFMGIPHGVQEYIERPKNIAAVVEGAFGTKPEAVERGMNAPVSNPVAYTPPPLTEPALAATGQAQQGDVAGALGTVTGAYGALPAVGYGLGKTGQAIVRGPGRALATTEGRTALSQARGAGETLQVFARGPDQPVQLLTQALKPRAANNQWNQAVDTAAKEIGASSDNLGLPITDIDSMHTALKDAKQRVWAQRKAIAGPQAERGASLDSVADRMESTISKYAEMMEPAEAQAIRDMAAKYRGKTFTIQEIEGFLQDVNKRLNSYYAKNPAAQRIAAGANPDIAALDAQARGLRSRLYEMLDAEGQGAAPRELSRRYGALLNVEEEIYRRKNVADRQAPVSLAEQMSFAKAAGQTARGVFRMKADPLGAAADIGEAWAMRQMAKELKEGNTTNALIERAFRNYKSRPLAVAYTPVQPKALLGPGPIVTPPPADPSGITVTTGPPLQPKIRGLLPRPPIITPPPPDPSGITVTTGPPLRPRTLGELAAPPLVTPPPADLSGIEIVDAARGIARDPKTGRLFRYYTSQRRE